MAEARERVGHRGGREGGGDAGGGGDGRTGDGGDGGDDGSVGTGRPDGGACLMGGRLTSAALGEVVSR